ncbi:MAG: hypothetical protein IK077_13905 [Thermoguttaceae bacterium]|nr:hypothetical protein [Thermoguttaceae bacterium]
MCITEFNDELYAAQRLEEGIEIGIEQGFKQGFEQGFKQGFEQGFKQGQLEVKKALAKKLLLRGWTIPEIEELFDVSVVDVDISLNSK